MMTPLSKLNIVQFSDIHISENEGNYQDIPVRENFLLSLQTALKAPADLLMITGDLAASRGELGAYQWLADQLSSLSLPIILLPGNHDHLQNMRKTLGPFMEEEGFHGSEYFFCRREKNFPLICLDTSSNSLSRAQLEWLKQTAAGFPTDLEEPAPLLFLHHPPLLCGCRFMDSRYPLQNIGEVWPALASIQNIQHIFCGHYHTSKHVSRDGKEIWLCPSTMVQLSGKTEGFAIESHTPAWRRIEWNGSHLRTKVHKLETVP